MLDRHEILRIENRSAYALVWPLVFMLRGRDGKHVKNEQLANDRCFKTFKLVEFKSNYRFISSFDCRPIPKPTQSTFK